MSGLHRDRVWIGGGVLAAVLIAALAWLMVISPQVTDRAEMQQQQLDAQTFNTSLNNTIGQLRALSENSSALTRQRADAAQEVPSHHRLDAFTRQLTSQAADADVTITSIAPSAPREIVMPGSAADTSADDSTGQAGQADNASDGPVGKVFGVDVSVAAHGSMTNLRAFLAAIEKQGPRRALVTSVGFSPISGDGADAAAKHANTWSAIVQLTVFVAPQSQAQLDQLAEQLGAGG